jgi:glycerate dehydrogenase
MKIVFMETDTLGKDVDLSAFDSLGEVIKYPCSDAQRNAERIMDADIVIVNKIPMNEQILRTASNVKLICLTSTGTNIVDFNYTNSHNIVVTNVKGYSTPILAV